MALTPSQRPTREWPLLILTVALVAAVFLPLTQTLAAEHSPLEAWAGWDGERWGRLFLGPAQFICYCCFTWAALILAGRYLEVRRQRRAFALTLLPTEHGTRILHQDARPLLRQLEQATAARGPLILAAMIRLALGKYVTSRCGDSVGQAVRSQAEVEQGRLVSSMATVHYLAWAIPAVGFLGTVVGLAGSLSMTGQLNEDAFLSRATRHLTFAFDCTLVALGLSLVLMFLLHSVQREEEALVLDCQQYCQEHLVNRLYEPESLEDGAACVAPLARGQPRGRPRPPARREKLTMTLFGLDLNAGRARVVAGPAGDYARPLPLEPPNAELCRRSPHLGRAGLLAALDARAAGRLDEAAALGLVLRRLARACKRCEGGVVALPAYLSAAQVARLFDLAERAGLRLLGCVGAPLALVLAAHAEREGSGPALVLDADEHALTLSVLDTADGQARLRQTQSLPRLGLSAWRERLVNAVADRCILQSRHDPRDCLEDEQAVFDALDGLLESCRQGRAATVTLQGGSWYQSLVLQPEDVVGACAALARCALEQVEHFLTAACADGPPGAVVVSAAGARLPGLVAALQDRLARWTAAPLLDLAACEDFGAGLLDEEEETKDGGGEVQVFVLGPDAAARAAQGLAEYFRRGDLPPGHLDVAAPLPLPQPAEAGPARLQYEGEEYLLDRDPFALGRQASCDLVFADEAYAAVSPRHCEIVRGGDGYTLWDRSRGDTFVNDSPVRRSTALQPGDSIRLGPGGPTLRFLGQPPPGPPRPSGKRGWG